MDQQQVGVPAAAVHEALDALQRAEQHEARAAQIRMRLKLGVAGFFALIAAVVLIGA
ncbi:hypothetical protein [uncultured Ramlibacter sp.]|uniref:hypothetical protein n=1 Tax=uncultured Ramlibacter sp. TaxID=260755 RepID=UPI00262941F2|nr:hypothetical protein [uncultured Ramlibacter sp.]